MSAHRRRLWRHHITAAAAAPRAPERTPPGQPGSMTFARPTRLKLAVLAVLLTAPFAGARAAGQAAAPAALAPDITGEYHFLAPEDTLAILEEEGKLKGYVDVAQPSDESDEVLSFPIALGTRQGNHVEFKTAKIHERYYRFSGTAATGKGRSPDDADFLRLEGDLDVVTVNAGEEHVEHRHEIFKWKSKSESDEGPQALNRDLSPPDSGLRAARSERACKGERDR